MTARIMIPQKACKISVTKSEILGYLAAEGEIKERRRLRKGNDRERIRLQKEKYCFFTNLEPILINRFQNDVERVYDFRPFYDVRKKRCTIKRIGIIEDLERYGKIASKEWKIPKEVLKNRGYLKAWLRAFFDGEAYVENDKKWRHKRIVLYSKNLEGLHQIRGAMLKLGIGSFVYPKTRKLNVSGLRNVANYERHIGFNHPKKRKVLKTITCNLTNRHKDRKETFSTKHSH